MTEALGLSAENRALIEREGVPRLIGPEFVTMSDVTLDRLLNAARSEARPQQEAVEGAFRSGFQAGLRGNPILTDDEDGDGGQCEEALASFLALASPLILGNQEVSSDSASGNRERVDEGTLPSPTGWQTIDSAPADVFLGFAPHSMGGYCLVACRNIDGEPASTDTGTVHSFTHWMPLPASPSDGAGTGDA